MAPFFLQISIKVVSIAEGFKQNTPFDMSLLWQSLINLPLQE
jgi:hypothetical protein